MKLPKVSIITVVFNGELFIEKTIHSVISQDSNLFEYIVIDGGSTDNTLAIVNKYKNHISKIISEKDEGIYDAMNKGILQAKGEWLIFINAGDVFYNEKTLIDINNELADNYDIVYGDVEIDYGFIKRKKKAGDIKNIWKGMQFSHQSCFVRAEYHKKVLYNTSNKIASDFEFFYESYINGRSFKIVDLVISTVISGGMADKNQISTMFEKYKAILRIKKSMKIHLYYTSIIFVTMVKTGIKKILPTRLKNKIISFK
jgi:glycosyltransferase involved in cell wall biosynthesis